jgi:hypothetical protein
MTIGEEPTDLRSPECLAQWGTGHHPVLLPRAPTSLSLMLVAHELRVREQVHADAADPSRRATSHRSRVVKMSSSSSCSRAVVVPLAVTLRRTCWTRQRLPSTTLGSVESADRRGGT